MRNIWSIFRVATLGLALLVPVTSQAPAASKNTIEIRGKKQDIYYYPAAGARLDRKVLFLPGDGGWRGYAITIAHTIASFGYDVYGLDTKDYLESFTGKTNLKETDVMGDLHQLGDYISQGSSERVALVGWSEGAGLCLLAAASDENKKRFNGLVTLGLAESNVLGWRWIDDITYITKKDPNEPMFQSAPYMSRVAPLPLLMVQSTQDDYVPVDSAKRLFAVAREPKQFALIQAQNHRFDGNRDEFFRTLRRGLGWINKTAH